MSVQTLFPLLAFSQSGPALRLSSLNVRPSTPLLSEFVVWHVIVYKPNWTYSVARLDGLKVTKSERPPTKNKAQASNNISQYFSPNTF